MTLAQKLALFISHLGWEDLPEPVRRAALDHLTDWMANAGAGAESPMGQVLLSLARPDSGPDAALVVGTLEKAEPLTAALVNAGASHSLEFDDSDRIGLFHPGAPVISAAWAAAGTSGASGRRLITSIVAGYEISMRLARAINPEHYRIWHTTGTVGALGAAAAAARCLGLGIRRTAWALGLAGTQAAGLWEVLPQAPLAKNLHPAKAAHSGLLAAFLAARGISGPPGILEGPRGFFSAMVPKEVTHDECTAALGSEWLIQETTIKAYPVCGHTMTPIEAALALHGRFNPDALEQIEVRVHPVSAEIAGNPRPKDEHQARFSIPYCVATALLKGRVTRDEFSAKELSNSEVNKLMARLSLVPDEELTGLPGKRPARVVLRLQGGETIEEMALIRKGDPGNPLSAREKMEKFRDLTIDIWGPVASQAIYRQIGSLPRCNDLRDWWASMQNSVTDKPGVLGPIHQRKQDEVYMKRDAIAIKTTDNVATAIRDLESGQDALVGRGEESVSITLTQAVPYGHKLALSDIHPGESVLKYGSVIGRATREIKKGEHVHVHNVESLRGRGDMEHCRGQKELQ